MPAIGRLADQEAEPAREPVLRGEFRYDVQTEAWAWRPVVRTDEGYDYLSVQTDGPEPVLGDIPGEPEMLEELGLSVRRGTPFSLGRSVVDDEGVAHDVVVCGIPEVNDGRTTVRGVVLDVTDQHDVLPQVETVIEQGDHPVPTLTQRLGPLPEGVTPDALPWADADLPEGLLTAINLCLESSSPTGLVWGPERCLLYNQAYVEIAGDLHPQLFGAPLPEAWPAMWAEVSEGLDPVFKTGKPYTRSDQMLPIRRDGQDLSCFFSYTFIPIRAEDGSVIGLFVPVYETTGDVLRRRRLATLHDLASEGTMDGSPEELYTRLATVLAGNPDDIPFSLMYLVEPSDKHAALRASTGLIEDGGCAPERMRLDDDAGWPIAEAISRGTPVLVDDVAARFPGIRTGSATTVPQRALITYANLGHERLPNAVHILGVGGHQALDAEYQAFLHKVARHLQADLTVVATAKLDRERSANLQRAMQSNRQIGAAIGILMTIHKVTEQQAFLLLSKASQQSNRKLRDIADDVILAGTLPPEAVAPPQRRGNRRRSGPSDRRPG